MKNRIRLTESQLHRVIKESVRKVIKEMEDNGIQTEVEDYVNAKGSRIEQWITPHRFVDIHGCDGSIYNSNEEAVDAILQGDEHQNAIDYVDGAMPDEDWISYLIHGGVNPQLAKRIIQNQDWDKVVRIIVQSDGPEWFLASYSGDVHQLSDGSLLFY